VHDVVRCYLHHVREGERVPPSCEEAFRAVGASFARCHGISRPAFLGFGVPWPTLVGAGISA
jgi:hypothetical protein